MTISLLTRSFKTAADVAGYLIVTATATDKVVTVASANTDLLLGTADAMGAKSGELLDVALAGVGEVLLGGTVKTGEPITSDGNAKGIKALPANSTQVRVIGYALKDGVSGDIINYQIALGCLSKASA